MERTMLRISSAARILGISRSTLYSMVSANEIPTIRIRNGLRIPSDALDAWIESRVVRSTNEIMSANEQDNADKLTKIKQTGNTSIG